MGTARRDPRGNGGTEQSVRSYVPFLQSSRVVTLGHAEAAVGGEADGVTRAVSSERSQKWRISFSSSERVKKISRVHIVCEKAFKARAAAR
jgi:hypothetical protein|eukprot:30497-Pelagococcus_subviridis.AAC.51